MNDIALHAALDFLDSWLAYRARHVDLPGFSIAIGYRDRIVFERAYGLARLDPAEPLTTQHRFATASQSKMFAATAILQLVQAGRLHLDDAAVQYVPWLTEHADPRWSRLTVRQLLSHSAGLPRDGDQANYWQATQPFPDATAFQQLLLQTKLAVQPNSRLKYSNLGYALLGQIIEKVTGQPYTGYIANHVFRPLNLTTMAPDYDPAQAQPAVTGYSPLFHHRRAVMPHLPTQALAPAIGAYGAAADLCRFASSQYFGNELILNDDLKREAQRDQWRAVQGFNQGMAFGLGFEIQTVGRRRLVGHSGYLAGSTTATFFDPEEQLAVSVASNCRHHNVYAMVNGLFEALDYFGEHNRQLVPASLLRFAGRFANQLASIEIVATTSRLVAIDPDDWQPFNTTQELERISDTTLRVESPGSVFDDGELCHYHFNTKAGTGITYAGFAMPSDRA